MTAETSFFRRFFAALDGEDAELAMQYVADDMEFAILWAPDTGRQGKQFVGGPDQLRSFTAAGDREGWAHHILHVSRQGPTEIALGETRWEDGRHIGTFVAAGELNDEGRLRRYLVGRSPALRFEA
jgi:ketosteroid isomerase-like protein